MPPQHAISPVTDMQNSPDGVIDQQATGQGLSEAAAIVEESGKTPPNEGLMVSFVPYTTNLEQDKAYRVTHANAVAD